MTIKELIEKLSLIGDQTQEVVLEDSILGLAVCLTDIREESEWQGHSIDLCGTRLPE